MSGDSATERLHAAGNDGVNLLINMMSITRECVLAQDADSSKFVCAGIPVCLYASIYVCMYTYVCM
jgi:hypothetical protein